MDFHDFGNCKFSDIFLGKDQSFLVTSDAKMNPSRTRKAFKRKVGTKNFQKIFIDDTYVLQDHRRIIR